MEAKIDVKVIDNLKWYVSIIKGMINIGNSFGQFDLSEPFNSLFKMLEYELDKENPDPKKIESLVYLMQSQR